MAAIKSEGLLGDKYVEISFGSVGAQKVKNGDTIAKQPPFEMSNMMAKASQILGHGSDAVANIGESADQLDNLLVPRSTRGKDR